MIPVNNEDLVLSSKCENSDSSLNKEHLLFSFIPSKYHIPFFTNRLFIPYKCTPNCMKDIKAWVFW